MRGRQSESGEPLRGLGATCMRYSPSGNFLAIGCKNGSLVVMAVEDDNISERGERRTASIGDAPPRHHSQGDSASGQVTGQAAMWTRGTDTVPAVEISSVMEGDATNSSGPAPSSPYHPQQQHLRKVYRRIAHLKGHSSRVLHLDWTVDGRFVHTCGQDSHILHWEILPPPRHRQDEGEAEEEGTVDGRDHEGDDAVAVVGQFQPRIFKRAFLVRDEQWATWSSTIGWPVQVRCREVYSQPSSGKTPH